MKTQKTKAAYKKQIKTFFKKVSKKKGDYIRGAAVREVGGEVRNLLGEGQRAEKRGDFRVALLIATAILEEMTEALNFADDSNADIGSNVYYAMQLLRSLTVNASEEVQKELFGYCLVTFQKEIFKAWDWHFDLLKLALDLFRTAAQVKQIQDCLEAVAGSTFDAQKAQGLNYLLLLKTGKEQEAKAFYKKYKSNSTLIAFAIKNAFEKEDYEDAIAFAKGVIEREEQEGRNVSLDWYNWLLKIAQKQEDEKAIVEQAAYLFIYENRLNQQD